MFLLKPTPMTPVTLDSGEYLMVRVPEDAKEFISEHSLPFEVAPWEHSKEFTRFKIGTCTGIWKTENKSYSILAITNDVKGNGHFDDVLQWFENSCRRDGYSLKFLEVWNPKLKKHLIEKRGFVDIGNFNLEKQYPRHCPLV